MTSRERNRLRTEGILSLLVLLVLIPTGCFVFWAKWSEAVSRDALLINEATSAQFAAALALDKPTAEKLVAYRTARGGFRYSEELLKVPFLDVPQTRPLVRRFLVRPPSTVLWHFLGWALAMGILVFLFPRWLRSRVGGDPFLVPLTLLLAGLGAVLLFSIKDPFRDQSAYEHHLRGTLLALVALTVTARLSSVTRARIRNYQYVWVFAAGLLVVGLSLFGHGIGGVKLNLFGFQPVEIIKLLLVFFLAGYLAERAGLIADTSKPGTGVKREAAAGPKSGPVKVRLVALGRELAGMRAQDIGPVVAMYLFALFLFLVVKDLGPAVLMFATFIAILTLTTGRGLFAVIGLLLLLVGAYLGYRFQIGVFDTRMDMWLSPFRNSHPNGMQLGQAYWGMASGGWSGSGLGLGMPSTIARAGSDMAFASWAEETGLFGAWLVLVVYVVLVWRGLRIALEAANDFDRALAFGLTALFGLQTLLILGGVTGTLPLSGIALPFLSYGNSALVANGLLIGLLRGISAPGRGQGEPPALRRAVERAARSFGLGFAVIVLGVIGLWRLGTLQLLSADAIAVRAVITPDGDKVSRPHINPRLLAMERAIERGSIYDRSGRILATSRPAELAKLARDPHEAQRLRTARERLYPYGPALAHLVGYLDGTVGGPTGFERAYMEELRGFKSHTELLSDYRRRHLPGYRPRRARDLHLTLDAELQKTAQGLLQAMASTLKDKRTQKPKDRAAYVLLDPRTGDVIVAATLPAFDPNTLTQEQMNRFLTAPEEKESHRLLNRAVDGLYPPGSTLKVATAACALDTLPDALNFAVVCNRISPDIRWQARGVAYRRRNVRDERGSPNFGTLTLAPALRVSSNIYFSNLAARLDPDTYRETLREKMQFRRTPDQKAFDADMPDIGYGQGRMLASPLEMARLTASVANNGTMMRPRFVKSLTDPVEKKTATLAPAVLSQAMRPQTAATLRRLMRGVVEQGSTRRAFGELSVPVAGKTGTAENEQNDKEAHAWFIGFAPYSESGQTPPRYAFACVVENGGKGRRVAAVLCRDMLRKLF